MMRPKASGTEKFGSRSPMAGPVGASAGRLARTGCPNGAGASNPSSSRSAFMTAMCHNPVGC